MREEGQYPYDHCQTLNHKGDRRERFRYLLPDLHLFYVEVVLAGLTPAKSLPATTAKPIFASRSLLLGVWESHKVAALSTECSRTRTLVYTLERAFDLHPVEMLFLVKTASF